MIPRRVGEGEQGHNSHIKAHTDKIANLDHAIGNPKSCYHIIAVKHGVIIEHQTGDNQKAGEQKGRDANFENIAEHFTVRFKVPQTDALHPAFTFQIPNIIGDGNNICQNGCSGGAHDV